MKYKFDIQLFAGTAFSTEVGSNILPATTQLKIAWTTDLASWLKYSTMVATTSNYFTIDSVYNLQLAVQDVSYAVNISSVTYLYSIDYTSNCGDSNNQPCSTYKYFILDTSDWTESQRTITTVDADASTYGLTYEDLAPASTWTVSFDSNGGSAVADIEDVEDGATISEPTAPTKANYTFAGWFTDDGTFMDAWVFASDTVTANITLYAKWLVSTKPTKNLMAGSLNLKELRTLGSAIAKVYIGSTNILDVSEVAASGYTVTINFTNNTVAPTYTISVYDSEDGSGDVVETLSSSTSYEVTCSSGYLFLENLSEGVSNITIGSPTDFNGQVVFITDYLVTVDSDGQITLSLDTGQSGN